MRAFVTGGAGFLGSALVDRLLAEGHQVDVVDDLSAGSLANLSDARRAADRRLTFAQLDVRSPALADAMARSRPDVVFHLADRAPAGPDADGPDGAPNPLAEADVNVIGSLRVLEASRAVDVQKVVVVLPAGAIYAPAGSRDLPLRESHPWLPATPHGVGRRAVAEYLRVYREVHSLEYTALAVGSVYGPRRSGGRGGGVVADFAERMVSGRRCVISGDGSQTRDFVFVDDVVDALARAAERGGGLLLNIGTGKETSVAQLHSFMAALAGTDEQPRLDSSRAREVRRLSLDPGRAAIHLGWKPWTDLEEGLAAVIDSARSAGAV